MLIWWLSIIPQNYNFFWCGGPQNLNFFVVLQMEQDPTNLYFSNLPKDFDERVSCLTKHYRCSWFFCCFFFFLSLQLVCLCQGSTTVTVGDFVVL